MSTFNQGTGNQGAGNQGTGSSAEQDDLGELVCSARGCTQPATNDLRWNNVKIHTPERRTHWLACDEHTESLSQYLSARGMLREVVPLGAPAEGTTAV